MAITRARVPLSRAISARTPVRPSSAALAITALVVANVAWGGSAVASKAALDAVPPMTLAALRVGVGFTALWLVLASRGARPATGRGPAILGLTGVALFCATQNVGLRYATAGTSALLNGAIPVLTMLLAVLFLGEQVTGRRLTGLLISFTGIVLLVLSGSGSTLSAAAGNVLPLASAISFSGYAVLGRRAFGAEDALSLVAGSTRYGLYLLLPLAGVEFMATGSAHPGVSDWLLVLYLGAGCSALAFVLYGYGLARIEAGHAATFGNLKPLVGIALAVWLLGEPISPDQIGGGALVLMGVGVVAWPSMERRPRRDSLTTRIPIHSGGRASTSRRPPAH